MSHRSSPTSRVGRPSKGDRHTFVTRVPRAAADRVQAEADKLGLSYSEYIAYVLSAAHGIQVDLPVPNTQEALPLQNVS